MNDDIINKLEFLSKLKLQDDEKESLKVDLQKMIAMFDTISKVDTGDTPPLIHVTDSTNIMGQDDIIRSDEDLPLLQSNAPMWEDEHFVVPKVIE